VRRFYYIGSPASNVRHRHFGKLLEGEAVSCGLRLQKGWKWGPLTIKQRLCQRCKRQ
jgi:hypothetical protein